MQIAFGKKHTYDRADLVIVAVGMGLYLSAATLNQAALARGQVRRASFCWIGCAIAFVVWTVVPIVASEVTRVVVGYLGAAALLCSLLYWLYRQPLAAARRRSSRARRRRWSFSSPRRTRPAELTSRRACRARGREHRLELLQRLDRAHRDQHVARSQDGVERRLGVDLGRRPADRRDRRRPPDLADRLPLPGTALGDVDLLHPVLRSDVHDAGDLRLQREARHLGPARLVGRDHPVRAGPEQLLLGVLDARPGDDRDVRAQLARGQAGEDVLRVGVDAGEHRDRALDPGCLQHLVVRGTTLQERRAHLVGDVLVLVELVDDDEVVAARLEVARDLPSHSAEAADQVVAFEVRRSASGSGAPRGSLPGARRRRTPSTVTRA